MGGGERWGGEGQNCMNIIKNVIVNLDIDIEDIFYIHCIFTLLYINEIFKSNHCSLMIN